MVAIKVQSLTDITEAYFKSLGFSGSKLKNIVKTMTEDGAFKIDNRDVVGSLDAIVLANVKQNFVEIKFPDEQKIAWFKAAFLLNDGAKRYGVDAFNKDKFRSEWGDEFKKLGLINAPEYRVSHMDPQKIESLTPLHILKRLFYFFRKG